jgi:hypothetical protein
MAADFGIFRLRMNGGQICGKGRDVVIILNGVIAQGIERQLAARPGLVKGMVQKMLPRNAGVNGVNHGL